MGVGSIVEDSEADDVSSVSGRNIPTHDTHFHFSHSGDCGERGEVNTASISWVVD